MSDRYLVRIEAWPYSSGQGSAIDQARAGPREQVFTVEAADFRAAMVAAELFRNGMLTNPFVWQTRIVEIRRADAEAVRFTQPDPQAVREAERLAVRDADRTARDCRATWLVFDANAVDEHLTFNTEAEARRMAGAQARSHPGAAFHVYRFAGTYRAEGTRESGQIPPAAPYAPAAQPDAEVA